jgi:hypothetical protein
LVGRGIGTGRVVAEFGGGLIQAHHQILEKMIGQGNMGVVVRGVGQRGGLDFQGRHPIWAGVRIVSHQGSFGARQSEKSKSEENAGGLFHNCWCWCGGWGKDSKFLFHLLFIKFDNDDRKTFVRHQNKTYFFKRFYAR